MSTKAPLSMCLIFRDDPRLEQAVASVRPYVMEICIVVDRDAPSGSFERVRALADVMDVIDWCDDFSFARNACLKLATQPYVGWMDTDDIVVGAEHFAREIGASYSDPSMRGRLLGPYDYETNDRGEVTRQQWRERIVPNDGSWIWEHPTHEGLVKKNGHKIDPGTDYWMKGVRWVHQRKETGARSRSLAILRKWHAAGHDDAWTHVNLGFELHAAGEFREALTHFSAYLEKSDWAEEKSLVCLRAADCEMALDIANATGGYARQEGWIQDARGFRPNDFEPAYAAAKLAYMRATMFGDPKAMRWVIEDCRRALACPETRTPIGRNPLQRSFDVYVLLQLAAEVEQDWATALDAVEHALEARPGDPQLTLARKRYTAAKLVASFAPAEKTLPPGYVIGVDYAHDAALNGERDLKNGTRVPSAEAPAKKPYTPPSVKRLVPRDLDARPEKAARSVEQLKGQILEGIVKNLRVRGVADPDVSSSGYGGLAQGIAEELVRVEAEARLFVGRNPDFATALGLPDDEPRSKDWDPLFAGHANAAPPRPLEIVFMCGPAGSPWNPARVEREGAGGSETAVVEVAKRLAKMGHAVRVLGNPLEEGTYDGVDYEQWTSEAAPKCDVAVVWRLAGLLPQADAKVRVAWAHDTEMIGMTYELSLMADRFLALSNWHKNNLIRVHGIPESQVFVTRNGIQPELYEGKNPIRHANRAIYCSSPDRGLGALLDMWPAIRARVPSAELDVYYSFANWQHQADERKDQQHRFLCSTLQKRMKALEPSGVRYRGMVTRRSLAQDMRAAGVWLYPTHFHETSCMTAMEARAAGMRIVATPVGALPETVGEYGTLLEGDWLSDDFQERFVEAAVQALFFDRVAFDGGAAGISREETMGCARETLGWDGVASSWDALFRELLEGAQHGALPAYREYREAVST